MKFSLAMQSIIQTFYFLQTFHGKNYSYPSQKKIIQLLKDHYPVNIKRRQLNTIIKYLEENGYLERGRRIKRDKSGVMVFKSTMYFLKGKAYRWLGVLKSFLDRTGFKLSDRFKKNSKKNAPPAENEQRIPTKEEASKFLKLLFDPLV